MSVSRRSIEDQLVFDAYGRALALGRLDAQSGGSRGIERALQRATALCGHWAEGGCKDSPCPKCAGSHVHCSRRVLV